MAKQSTAWALWGWSEEKESSNPYKAMAHFSGWRGWPARRFFTMKGYSWWHCIAVWAPQNGQEGRNCGPELQGCTWATTVHCTVLEQTCRRERKTERHIKLLAAIGRDEGLLTIELGLEEPQVLFRTFFFLLKMVSMGRGTAKGLIKLSHLLLQSPLLHMIPVLPALSPPALFSPPPPFF